MGDPVRTVTINLFPGQVLVVLDEEDCDYLIDACDGVLKPEEQESWEEAEKRTLKEIRKSLANKAKKARQDARKGATLTSEGGGDQS